LKRFLLIMLSLIIFRPALGLSQEPLVLVLPFDVQAQKDLFYLQTDIPVIIQKGLKNVGLETVGPEVLSITGPISSDSDLKTVQTLAKEAKATHVVWGVLEWVGEKFELVSHLLAVADGTAPEQLTASGESIENLLGVVQGLASEIGKKLVRSVVVASLSVEGNVRIEEDAIKRVVTSKPGDEYAPKRLSADLKAVYAMGYFDDIRIESEDSQEGKIITFHVKEKPTIKSIEFKGNFAIKSDKLEENLDISVGSILNIFSVRKNMERLKLQFEEKNYLSATVTYEAKPLKNNQVALSFIIDEGEKISIKKITLIGNKAFSTKKLRKLMKTSEKGLFSWITSSGDYKEDLIKRDAAVLGAFYQNNGYMQARVAEPEVEKKDNWIFITIKLVEGPQYKIGTVDVIGDLVLPKEVLIESLAIAKETFFNRDMLREDMLALNDICAVYGYAFADTAPLVDPVADENIVNITYKIDKGKLVFFEKIIIGGNTKTRDKVIRRELKVEEQGQYSSKLLNKSIKNLNRLNYFEDVQVNTQKGASDDTMVLRVGVVEKPTGAFTFGGGYSSVEELFLTASITQDNLFGRGQSLALQTQLGSRTTQFNVKFVEPWLFDIPLAAGVTVYNWARDYDTYDKDSMGGSVSLSYPFFEDLRFFTSYGFDVGEITDVYELEASQDIIELTGTFITSSISMGASYDTRDRIINPSSGQDHRLSLEYAGIGGDIGFTKVIAEAGWYIPLFWKFVGFVHGELGYVNKNSGMTLPDYERFYLGGINSVRGFDWRDIHLRDEKYREIGGDRMIQINLEVIFPLLKDAGLMGVIFFDTGQVFGDSYKRVPNGEGGFKILPPDEDGIVYWETERDNDSDKYSFDNLRKTVGFGFRWYSPMGPIRIEYGHILDSEDGDNSKGKWEFTMGAAF
jgi:outer membrane protein insertion porin family